MKYNYQILLCSVLFLSLSAPVWAQNTGPYLGVFVGGQMLAPAEGEDSLGTFNLEYRPAATGSIVLGRVLEPGSRIGEGRIEVEISHRSNRLDRVEFIEGKVNGAGELTVDSLLFNSYGVYRTASLLTPYLGAGVGIAKVTAEDLTITDQPLTDDDALVLAYQVGTGVEVELTDALTLDLGYRFFGSTKAKFIEASGDELKTEYFSHSAMIGLRLGF